MDDASDSIIAIVRALILAAPPGHLPQVVAHLAEVVNDDELLGDVYPPLCLEYLQQHGAVLLLPVSRLKGPSFAALTPAPGHNHVRIVASNLTSLATWIRCIAELPDVERARYLGMHTGAANEGDDALVWSLLDPEAQLAEEVEAYFHDRRCIDVGEDEVRYDVEACAGCTSGDAQEEESGNLFADLVECFGFEHLDSVFFSLRDGIYVEVDPVEGRCLRVIPFASHEEGSGSSSLPLPPILRCIETQRFANVGMPLLPSPSSAEAVLQTYAEERFGTGGKTAGSFPRRATFLPVHSPEEANDGDDLPKAVARQFAERRQCDAATAVVAYPSTSTHDEGATSRPALSMSLVAAWTRPGLGWTARWHSDYRLAVGPEIRTSLQGATSVHIFFSDATPHPEALSGLPTDHSTSMHYTTSLDLVATPVRDENGASPSLPLWLDVLATHERRVQDELTRTVSSTQRNLLAPMWPSRMDGCLANLRRETPVVGSSFPVTTKVAQ